MELKNRIMRYLLFTLTILLFLVGAVSCGIQEEDNEAIEEIESFIDLVGADKENEAFDMLFSSNKYFANDSITRTLLIQLENATSLLGNYHGHERIARRSFGKDYFLYSYIVKYERQPLRFTFVFYRPGAMWKIQNFKFDVDFDEELERAAEVYFLKENFN